MFVEFFKAIINAQIYLYIIVFRTSLADVFWLAFFADPTFFTYIHQKWITFLTIIFLLFFKSIEPLQGFDNLVYPLVLNLKDSLLFNLHLIVIFY